MSEPTPSNAVPPGVFLPRSSPLAARREGRSEPPSVPGYEILDKLGEGGMGTVYRARQLAAGRVVALKLVKAGRRDDADAVARFRAEARRVASLQHPHIIQIHEVGEGGGVPFFTMDYCAGGSLDRKLAGAPLPPKAAAALVEALARAVQTAHDHGIVHRDLKPGNVLLGADGQPKVTDFGLARQLDEAAGPTLSHAVLGTPSYMAPEQTFGKAGAAGPPADVYALGAILYECLTGRPPFLGPTALDTLLLVRTEEPAAPSQLQPKTPRDLETICLKCLRKEARRRYPTAAALAEDLRRFRTGEPIAARPVGTAERLQKWARRRPVVAALLVGLIGALAVGTAVSTYFALEAGRRARDADVNAAIAHAREQEAQEKETEAQAGQVEAEQAQLEAEAATARGILRPLKLTAPLDDAEWDALWELAESRSDSLGVQVFDQALRRPASARPLMSRMDFVIHTAVGLDSDRRRRVEEKLLAVLRDGQADPELRADCVHLALALDERGAQSWNGYGFGPADDGDSLSRTSPEFARQAGLALAAAARNAGSRLNVSGSALRALAGRLDHDGATAVVNALTDAMANSPEPYSQLSLAQGLAGALDRLPPDERAAPARVAVHALADAMPKAAAKALAGPPPKVGGMTWTPKDSAAGALASFANGLHVMLLRLPPGEAAGPARGAARLLTDALPAAVIQRTDYQATWNLSQGLVDVASDLDAAAAADAVRALTEAVGRISDLDNSVTLGRALAAVAARLDRAAAADAAAVMTEAIKKAPNPYVQGALAQGLGPALGRLPPDEAAPQARAAARTLIDAMAKETDYSDPKTAFKPLNDQSPGMAFTAGFEAVTERLDARDQGALARAMTDALTRTNNQDAASRLLRALPAVSAELNPDDEAVVVAALLVAAYKTTDSFTVDKARQAISLFDRLNPARAAAAARAVADAVTQAPNLTSVNAVTSDAPKLAARLDHDGAAAVADELAERIAKTLPAGAPPVGWPYQAGSLALELAAVLGRLPPDEAAPRARSVARPLADALKKISEPNAAIALAQGLGAVLERLPREEAAPLARDAEKALTDLLKTMTPQNGYSLVLGLTAIAPRLDRDGAVTLVRALADLLANSNDASGASTLQTILNQVAFRLDRDAAAGAVEALDQALAGNPSASASGPLKQALDAAVRRRDEDPNLADDPRQLADDLVKGQSVNGIAVVAMRLGASLGRLDHDETAAVARKLADALPNQTEYYIMEARAKALGDALDRLPSDEAAAIARKPATALVTARLQTGKGMATENQLTYFLLLASARTNGLDEDRFRGLAVWQTDVVRQAVAPVGLSPSPFMALPVLALAAQPPRSRLATQDLVDLLKQPSCIGLRRDVLLRELGGQCGQRFDAVWDFVEWAEAHRPDLDLKSPPRRDLP